MIHKSSMSPQLVQEFHVMPLLQLHPAIYYIGSWLGVVIIHVFTILKDCRKAARCLELPIVDVRESHIDSFDFHDVGVKDYADRRDAQQCSKAKLPECKDRVARAEAVAEVAFYAADWRSYDRVVLPGLWTCPPVSTQLRCQKGCRSFDRWLNRVRFTILSLEVRNSRNSPLSCNWKSACAHYWHSSPQQVGL
jgi:hypothetical protein